MPGVSGAYADFPADAEVPELDNDVGTGREGDVEARCFSTFDSRLSLFSQQCHAGTWDVETDDGAERDSPRDQLVVTFFVLTVVALLLFAAIGSRSVYQS